MHDRPLPLAGGALLARLPDRPRTIALGGVLLAAASFGTAGIATGAAVDAGLSPTAFLLVRSVVGALLLLLVAGARGERPTLDPADRRPFLVVVGSAAFVSAALTGAFAAAPAAIVTGVFYLYPALVAVVAARRHEERLGHEGAVGIATVLMGILLLAGGQAAGGAAVPTLALLLAGLAAVGQATWFRAVVRVRSMPPLLQSALVLGATAVLMLLLTLAGDGLGSLRALADPRALVAVAWAGGVCAALPTLLLVTFLRRTGATTGAVAMLAEPVTAALAGAAVLGQPLPLIAVAGVVLVVGGAARLATRPDRAQARRDHRVGVRPARDR